ncbi:MAG: replication-associated recombination protein A, partial [Candidatus Binatia bacterium]
AHDFEDHIVDQQHLPQELLGRRYYMPGDAGYETAIKDRLKLWEKKKNERKR